MTRTLDVYLQRDLVGRLTQDDHGLMFFEYVDDWVARVDAVPLSRSLPLGKKIYPANECRGFFAGILPEMQKREIIARNLGISAHNDFSLLEQIGGECAGAVTFIPAGAPFPENNYHYRALNESELVTILKALPTKPLLAGDEDVRLSLAGAQDKIAVQMAEDKIALPLGGAPSTHILKPAVQQFEGLVFNEGYCMQLAIVAGLPAAGVRIQRVRDLDYLLVERYDRTFSSEHEIRRLHQEDFCQALGITPDRKYQSEGGPGLKHCFNLLRATSTHVVDDLQRLLDAVIFNGLIGNNDAHGKNFSLLYSGDTIRLAPLYDLLSTIYYPELTKKMAMKIGGEYEFDKIVPYNFEKLALDTGLGKALVRKRVMELTEIVLSAADQILVAHAVTTKLTELIKQRCRGVLNRFRRES